jgi:hypothetical protein
MYEHAQALFISWEGGNEKVQEQLKDLQSLFEQQYDFPTEHWMIPSVSPHRALVEKICDFTKAYDRLGTLLVVYYGGHAESNVPYKQLRWKLSV